MFVLELTYTAPIERIDALLEDHRAWLTGHYDSGAFIASGPKVPREGGLILADFPSRADVDAAVATDPFVTAGVCTYRITEFAATRTAPALEEYRQPV
ncbi:hypothetical protein GCM10010218_04690 [Streptomyces mashuensis]|uniref:YCII-related domain-containing protein n=1 Tax=Streptomyces mashuensis TaxID=33904 RepID=A0A919AUK5_9ACTN|nr:YciI family protein [Streptomyces mashuensis]GHF26824.1 hypothetical protein GCM10010218_04690 [Streptomyces mashuensis]